MEWERDLNTAGVLKLAEIIWFDAANASRFGCSKAVDGLMDDLGALFSASCSAGEIVRTWQAGKGMSKLGSDNNVCIYIYI